MRVNTGKHGKRVGAISPRDARKIDGDKPIRGLGDTVPLRNFGYTYQWRFFIRHGWRTRTVWFKTKTSRDQSLEHFGKSRNLSYYRNVKAIDR